MRTSPEINELAAALSLAQGEIQDAPVDSRNPHFSAAYASLESVLKQIRPIFAKYGLSICQVPGSDDTGHFLTTLLMHKSGQFIESHMNLALGKNDMQGLGSALSYARRYMAQAMTGISQSDDDGSLAAQQAPQKKAPEKKPEPPRNVAPNDNSKIGIEKAIDLFKRATEKGSWTRDQVQSYIKSVYKNEVPDITFAQAKEFLEISSKRTFDELASNEN